MTIREIKAFIINKLNAENKNFIESDWQNSFLWFEFISSM